MRVALCQMDVVPGDLAGNVDRTLGALREAAAEGAGLVVLPELVATGVPPGRGEAEAVAAALEESPAVAGGGGGGGPRGGGARGGGGAPPAAPPAGGGGPAGPAPHDLFVVGGLVESAGGRFYNTAAVVGPRGLVGRYRKLHLFGPEIGVFEPGDAGLPVFELPGIRLGVAVCYDLRFPEVVRILALRGVDVVAVPTAWVTGFDRESHLAGGMTPQGAAAAVQANLSQVYLAVADRVGTDTWGGHTHTFLGASCLLGPTGAVEAGPAPPTREAVLVGEVTRDAVTGAQQRGEGITPRRQRRTDVYGELLGYVGE